MASPATVVLIHGALMDRHSMLALLPHLPPEPAYLVPDLAGHGARTGAALPARLDPPGLAAELIERCALASRREPLLLIGHSLGALVALALQEQLTALGRGARQLILGDPPLFPCGDTDSQRLARAEMERQPLGARLLEESFGGFALQDPTASLHLASLRRCLALGPVTTLVGGRAAFQRPDGSQDCGTFLSQRSRGLLLQTIRDAGRDTLQAIHLCTDLGHWVLHDLASLKTIAGLIGTPPA